MKRPHVVHHVPGRVRIRVPGSRGEKESLDQLAQSLSQVPGIEQVRVSPGSASIIVHYQKEAADSLGPHPEEAVEQLLSLAVPDEAEEVQRIERAVETEAELLAKHSETARQLVDFVKDLNNEVKIATGNAVDLRVMLPLGAAVASAFSATKPTPSPLWVTLLIFSFNSFVSLHKAKMREGEASAHRDVARAL